MKENFHFQSKYFHNLRKHGRGKITYLNGDTFEGQFENDNINGEGLFKSKYIIK